MPCDLFMRLLFEQLDNTWLCDGSPHGTCWVPSNIGFQIPCPSAKNWHRLTFSVLKRISSQATMTHNGQEPSCVLKRQGTDIVHRVSSPIRERWPLGYAWGERMARLESQSRLHDGWGGLRDQEYKPAAQFTLAGFVDGCGGVFRRVSKTDTQDLGLSCCGRPFFRPSTGAVPNACARSLHFLDGKQETLQRQARPARSCSRRAPSKLVTRQLNAELGGSSSGIIFEPHAQVFDIDPILFPARRFLHGNQWRDADNPNVDGSVQGFDQRLGVFVLERKRLIDEDGNRGFTMRSLQSCNTRLLIKWGRILCRACDSPVSQ